jgi:hypothetical protein
MDSLRYLVEGAHVPRVKFKVASQFHHLLKIKTCCDAAMSHWGQSGVEMTEILVRPGGDLFAEAEVLFDDGDADFKLEAFGQLGSFRQSSLSSTERGTSCL